MRPRSNLRVEDIARLLLVRLREIGDVVFTTPAVRALREHMPDAHLTYLVEPPAADVVRNNPNLDQVLVAPARRGAAGILDDAALVRRLRAMRFDAVIDFHGGPRASLLTWLSGAPIRIGYDVAGRGWMYTCQVPRARELRPRHSVENQCDLLAPLGIPAPSPESIPVEMPLDPHAAQRVAERLTLAGTAADERVIVLHVSAGNPFRRWPLDAFVALVSGLAAADRRHRIVLTSGPSDFSAAEQVVSQARAQLSAAEGGRILTCGDFSLAELRALLDRAALYIGGDSGPMHIAATTEVPIVSLYGPTLPARSRPWRDPRWASESIETAGLDCRPCDQRRCVPGDFRCLARIRPEQVLNAAMALLARSGGNMERPRTTPTLGSAG
jgi:lipopolysaccharide heptosyltransferase II